MEEIKSARIKTSPRGPAWKPENFLLLDPDQPKADPNELLKLRRGQMADPATMNHNCPCCGRTMAWPLFKAHALDCYRKWRRPRLFTGGNPNA